MRLTGISCAVPRNVAAPDEAYERFGREDVEKIVANSGVRARRVVDEGTTSADLCLAAAEPLLDRLGWPRESLDILIFVSQTPDYVLPATSYCLQGRLGLPDTCLTLDVGLGCSGFTHGLVLAHDLLAAGRGRRALLLCGDTISRIASPLDRGTALLFGDAGTAAALDNEGADQLRAAVWGSEGTGWEHLIVPGGGYRSPWRPEYLQTVRDADGNSRRRTDLKMDGAQVFNFTIRRVPPAILEAMRQAGWSVDDVDAFLFHQANRFMIDYLRRKVKAPGEKVPTCLEEFGNTSSASIPQTMVTRLADRLAGPCKLILVGFGVGLSWSSVALEPSGLVVPGLIEV